MWKKAVFVMLLGIVGIISCKKEGPASPETGIFRGVFSRIFESGDTSGTGVVFVSINESGRTFSLQGDTSSNVPYSCSGTYTIPVNGKIQFTNKAAIAQEDTDPFYNRFYILDTTFSFDYQDSVMFFSLEVDDVTYDYNLTRF